MFAVYFMEHFISTLSAKNFGFLLLMEIVDTYNVFQWKKLKPITTIYLMTSNISNYRLFVSLFLFVSHTFKLPKG